MTELINDPNQIASLAAKFESPEADIEITTTPPPSDEVILPGGFITEDGTLVKSAQIRELNGADEEALAKAGSPSRAVQTALSRGLLYLGDTRVTSKEINSLLAGDRDAILLGILSATFGSEVDFAVNCPSCFADQTVSVDLNADVPVKELEDPFEDRVFEVKGKAGLIVASLPNGITSKKVADADGSSLAEIVTIILSGCIISVNDVPSMGVSTALNLGIQDRNLLIDEIYSRNPGPRLGEVSKACQACGADIPLSLSLATLFRLS
jgi:hypothetical protein